MASPISTGIPTVESFMDDNLSVAEN